VGSRKNPIWRVVVADQRSPRDGRVIETIGRYNAQTEPSEIHIDQARLEHWLARGAQPSDTVRKLMRAAAAPASEVPAPASGSESTPAEAATQEPAADAAPAAEQTEAPPEGEGPVTES
jgi:small subunit ribosomal protein S16